jgi:two-component system nitrate/nitrite response regulator NarL
MVKISTVPQAGNPVKILVVDDHEVVRQGIRTILSARPEWEICGEAVNGQEAIKLAEALRPDAIIMDITMPIMSGLEAARQITRNNNNSAPILIFTMHESRTLADSVRETGARGFVFKSRAAQDLINALDVLLQNGTYFGPNSGEKNSPAKDNTNRGISFLRALDFLKPLAFGSNLSQNFSTTA